MSAWIPFGIFLLLLAALEWTMWRAFRGKIGAIGALPVESDWQYGVFRHLPRIILAHTAFLALIFAGTFLLLW